jgi:hypothetical protein
MSRRLYGSCLEPKEPRSAGGFGAWPTIWRSGADRYRGRVGEGALHCDGFTSSRYHSSRFGEEWQREAPD